jgi:hypothetical protein
LVSHTRGRTYVDSKNTDLTFLSSAEIPAKNNSLYLVVMDGIPITVTTHRCVSTCFSSVVIMMNEQVVPSAVAQSIIVKFVIEENAKPAEILMRPRAQFDDEKLLARNQVCDWSKSFKEGRTVFENMSRLHLLQGKLGPVFLRDSKGVFFFFFFDFLIEQRTINATYYSRLLKDRVKPAFRSKRRGRSVNIVCLLHAAAVTKGKEEMH